MRSVKSDGLLVLVAQLQLQSLQKERSEKNCFLLQSKIKFAKLYGKLLTQRASKRSCC